MPQLSKWTLYDAPTGISIECDFVNLELIPGKRSRIWPIDGANASYILISIRHPGVSEKTLAAAGANALISEQGGITNFVFRLTPSAIPNINLNAKKWETIFPVSCLNLVTNVDLPLADLSPEILNWEIEIGAVIKPDVVVPGISFSIAQIQLIKNIPKLNWSTEPSEKFIVHAGIFSGFGGIYALSRGQDRSGCNDTEP